MQTLTTYVPVVIAAGIFTLITIFVIYGAVQVYKRTMQAYKGRLELDLGELAQRLGLDFNGKEDWNLVDRYRFLKHLAQAENRYATNIFSGTYQQKPVLAFDYHYGTPSTSARSGRTTTEYWFSFFIMTMPAAFPDLTIRRENSLSRIAEVFGYQDIKFESAEFSKLFCVRSCDKKFAYAVCNAKMIEYLLDNPDLSVVIELNVIALVFPTRLRVEQVESDLRRLVDIRQLLPEYLFSIT